MKFTKGYWLNRPGVEAADAVQIREVKIEKNRVYLYSVPYPQDVRAMGGPVLEMFISSPKADIIRTCLLYTSIAWILFSSTGCTKGPFFKLLLIFF